MAGPVKFTKENAAEKGRKGGIKSGEVRRQKRELRNIAQTIMSMTVKKGELEDYDSLEEAKGKNLTIAESGFIAQALKMLKGDTKAAEFCFEKAGLNPVQEIDITADVNETNDELANILNVLTDYKAEQAEKTKKK